MWRFTSLSLWLSFALRCWDQNPGITCSVPELYPQALALSVAHCCGDEPRWWWSLVPGMNRGHPVLWLRLQCIVGTGRQRSCSSPTLHLALSLRVVTAGILPAAAAASGLETPGLCRHAWLSALSLIQWKSAKQDGAALSQCCVHPVLTPCVTAGRLFLLSLLLLSSQ